MSRIFITGDTHGDFYYRMDDLKRICPDLSRDDFLIICGDCGVIWGPKRNERENCNIRDLARQNVTICFCDGNHEGFTRLYNDFPVVDFHGGKAHKISDNVYHLMRGEMFDIAGHKILSIGGARSHDIWNLLDPNDKNYRKKVNKLYLNGEFYREVGISWWEEEIPSNAEFRHIYETLKENDWKCDVIISHEAPLADCLFLTRDGGVMSKFLGFVKNATDFKKWFYGHHHVNWTTSENTRCLYSEIRNIDDDIICDPDDSKPVREYKRFTKKMLDEIIKEANIERKDVLDGKYNCDK